MILSPLSLFNFISFVTFILFPLPLETLLVLQYKSNQYFYHYFFLLFLSSFSPFRYFLHALFCHFVIISILKTLVSSPFISQSKIYSLLKSLKQVDSSTLSMYNNNKNNNICNFLNTFYFCFVWSEGKVAKPLPPSTALLYLQLKSYRFCDYMYLLFLGNFIFLWIFYFMIHHFILEIDRCMPNPCLNAGVCFENADSYTCQCSNGYKGLHCAGTLLLHFLT